MVLRENGMVLSRERAAQAWCQPKTSHITMIPELAEEFAIILNEIWNQPWLGNATNEELIEELKTRFYMGSNAPDYKTTSDNG